MASFTKKAIRESFEKLILEKPIDKITVKDITQDCGIARNTFYYHYRDIYAVLEDVLDLRVNQIVRRMKEKDSRESIEEACKSGFEELKARGDIFYQMYRSNNREEVRRYFDKTATTLFDNLVELKSQGIEASQEDRCLIAKFYRNAVTGFLLEWMESGMKLPLEDIFRRMSLLFGDDIARALKRSQELGEE